MNTGRQMTAAEARGYGMFKYADQLDAMAAEKANRANPGRSRLDSHTRMASRRAARLEAKHGHAPTIVIVKDNE